MGQVTQGIQSETTCDFSLKWKDQQKHDKNKNFEYFFPWARAQSRLSQLSHSVMSDSATPWITAHQASLSFTNSQSLLKFTSIKSVMPSNHLILCCSLLLLPSVFPSIRVFSTESVLCIRWPKYWSFSFSTSPSNDCSGLISFRIDWFDLCSPRDSKESLSNSNNDSNA